MFNLKQLTIFFFLAIGTHTAFSQLGISHEVGVIVGPVQFRSDFGVRNSGETNFGNTGIGIGLIHYINFAYRADCNCYSTDTFFNDHFKLRSELSYNKTKLDHFGEFVVPDNRLRAHKGEANNLDIGMQLEYFPLSIRSFQGFAYRVAPFISLGAHYTSFTPKASTTWGDQSIQNPGNFYYAWNDEAVNPASGSSWSTVASIGARYKLTVLSDLMIDLRWQYYFSDWIDGLNHNLSYNKHNDWLVWLNFGYIYYLD
ncbi:glutamate dehydrogenase [Lacinutrix iliipiscaria]|uniref:Glutamate dehydrogenase n=1 Tax=Lacinutrix iliipiscaria TaxID=1230532 RepID=A0ABW5WLF5_9FLAO